MTHCSCQFKEQNVWHMFIIHVFTDKLAIKVIINCNVFGTDLPLIKFKI